MLVDFDRKNLRCPHGLRHRNRKQPDRSTAGDGYGFCGDLPGQHGMNGIAQRIEDGGILLRNGGIELPDIGFGNDHVLGEGAVGIDADDFHVLADVRFAGAALQALAASHVHLGGDKVAFFHAGDFIAESRDFAAEFVAGNQRRVNAVLRPAIPVVDVQVGAADGRDFHFDQDVVASEGGNLYFADLRARRGFRLDHRQHCSSHDCHL